MNQRIVLLRKERDELLNKFIKERDELYELVYADEIDALNKKINQLQNVQLRMYEKDRGLE